MVCVGKPLALLTAETQRARRTASAVEPQMQQMDTDTDWAACGRVEPLGETGGGMTNDEVPNDEGSPKPEARSSRLASCRLPLEACSLVAGQGRQYRVRLRGKPRSIGRPTTPRNSGPKPAEKKPSLGLQYGHELWYYML